LPRPYDKRQPHQLTPAELSGLLRNLGICIKTVWPVPRLPESKSVAGYYFCQFEKAWMEHHSETDTPTQPNKVIRLPRH
jgi:hypothetical protein